MTSKVTAPKPLIAIALVSGLVFDWLFYGKTLGISVPIFTIALIVALYGAGLLEAVSAEKRNRWLILPTLFFAGMAFIRANPFLTFLNICATMFLLMLVAYYYAHDSIVAATIAHYVRVPLATMFHALFGGIGTIGQAARETVTESEGRRSVRPYLAPVLRGLILALPILIVFTLLLVSADAIFADKVSNLLSIEQLDNLIDWFWQLIVVLWVAWLVTGVLVFALTRDSERIATKLETVSSDIAPPRRLTLGFIESTVILNTINLLFAGFVWVQFTYLFGGARNVTIDGFTYAEYARRGFFEMVTVAILTLGLILLLKMVTRRETSRQQTVFNASSTLIVAFVTVMLVSAFQRMRLYELTYGFTELRLYPHIFMVWLGIVFVWFIVTLWLKPNRFAIGLFLCGLGYVATLNMINPDAFIVRQNFHRYQLFRDQLGIDVENTESAETTQNARSTSREVTSIDRDHLDVAYLRQLSDDAIPAIIEMLDQFTPNQRAALKFHLQERHVELAEQLNDQPWQSFHLSHHNALKTLNNYFGPTTIAENEAESR